MIKSKLELILEDRFDLVDKDDDFYLVSKDFFNKDRRSKVIIAVRYNESDENKDEIIITANSVDSLSFQKHSEIEFMLEYYPFEDMDVEDVLTNKEKYEVAGVYADLYEDGFYDEIDMMSINDQETIKEINSCDFWQNSNALIIQVLEVLSSVSSYFTLSQKLKLNILENNIFLKREDLIFDAELDLILRAINTGWESLNFESRINFAELSGELGSIILETNGEVTIVNTESNEKHVGTHIFENQEIVELLKSGDIYNGEKYVIDDNNWFSLSYLNKEDKYVDDFVFESNPETINELVSEMKKAYDYFTELEEETKEVSIYIVLARREFCYDGQLVENAYFLDLMNSEHIDSGDYDKRDFDGEFVLGVYKGTSIENVIKLVSEMYEMEEGMLKAYKLA